MLMLLGAYFTGGRGWARSITPSVISYHIISSAVLWDSLGVKIIDLFYLKPLSTKCDFIDIIKNEFQEF